LTGLRLISGQRLMACVTQRTSCCSSNIILPLAVELSMRPLIAHCHLGLGKLYHRTDKREQAQEHLTTATTMYRDMGMTYWLEKAEAETTKPGG
jgi:hypothetical protein